VDLLGLPFLLLLLAVALLVLVGIALAWNRWPGWSRWPARALSLVLVMVLGAVVAGDLVNRSFGLYGSFSELLGRPPSATEPVGSFAAASTARLDVLTSDWVSTGQAAAAQGRGTVVKVRMAGPRSGFSRVGLVYLPAAYFDDANARFPAIEFFHGTPGGPRNYVDQLHVGTVLDGEIKQGRIPPVIGIFPMIDNGRPGECVDAVRGPKDETYLAVDVPADVDAGLRGLPGRSFAAVGYSTGGFCALNLGLRHPDRYVAAGGISAYFEAGTDPAVGNPYGRGSVLRLRNSPQWEVEHRRPTAPPLFVVASAGDRQAASDERTFVAASRRHDPRLVLGAALVPGGGHTFATWSTALAPTIDWVAHYLPRDLAPPLLLPRLP
jgi:pimeloyl-ACP methyl ester carboxylesterase